MLLKENVLFNDAINTFYYDYMIKDQKDNERRYSLPPLNGLLLLLFLYAPSHR